MTTKPISPVQTRSIDDVLFDLRAADRDRCEAYRDFRRAYRETDLCAETDASERLAYWERRMAGLRAEFATLFLAATGTEWSRVKRAIDEGAL